MKTYIKVAKLLTSKQARSKAVHMETMCHGREQCGRARARARAEPAPPATQALWAS